MLKQSFQVVPDGHIQSGHLEYQFDEHSGAVSYSGSATVKIMFFTKTFDLPQATDKVDPASFLSAKFSKPGAQLKMGDFVLTVVSISNHVATCSLAFKDYKGVGTVDISGQYVKILTVSAFGNVPVIGSVHLMLQAV